MHSLSPGECILSRLIQVLAIIERSVYKAAKVEEIISLKRDFGYLNFANFLSLKWFWIKVLPINVIAIYEPPSHYLKRSLIAID